MPEVTPDDILNAIGEVRKQADENGKKSSYFEEALDKTEKVLLEGEKKHNETVKSLAKAQKESNDLRERICDLECHIAKTSVNGGKSWKSSPEYKALQIFAKHGRLEMDPNEFKTLRTDIATQGGVLTIREMDSEILRSIEEISAIRSVSRVKETSEKTFDIVVRTSIPDSYFVGETEDISDSESSYGMEEMATYAQGTIIPFTRDQMMNSAFDLVSEIQVDVSSSLAKGEGRNFVIGDGVKKPEGFLSNPAVVADTQTSENAGSLTGDDLLNMQKGLKTGYNAIYGFNRSTWVDIMTLKDSEGAYLWIPSLRDGAPNLIGGKSYIEIPDMPSVAANNKSVVFADFMRGYTILDRTGMEMVRDEITQAGKRIIRLIFWRFLNGQVVLPEAFQILTIKA